MKQGFLLSYKAPIKEDKNNSIVGRKSLGPLQDGRIDRTDIGWGSLPRQSGLVCTNSSDPWENPIQSIATHQHDVVNKSKTHDAESLDYVKSDYNPYLNVPNLPFKTASVPMNALGCYYGKYYNSYQIKMSEYYFSWNDQNPKSHLLRWTSIFLCPISGEIFITGSWPNNEPSPFVESPLMQVALLSFHEDPHSSIDESKCFGVNKSKLQVKRPNPLSTPQRVRWMKTKKTAEHGAAAWAYDCLQYRNQLMLTQSVSEVSKAMSNKNIIITGPIGSEIPYTEQAAIMTVPEFVPHAMRGHIEQRLEEVRNGALTCNNDNIRMEMEEELAWYSSKSPV